MLLILRNRLCAQWRTRTRAYTHKIGERFELRVWHSLFAVIIAHSFPLEYNFRSTFFSFYSSSSSSIFCENILVQHLHWLLLLDLHTGQNSIQYFIRTNEYPLILVIFKSVTIFCPCRLFLSHTRSVRCENGPI